MTGWVVFGWLGLVLGPWPWHMGCLLVAGPQMAGAIRGGILQGPPPRLFVYFGVLDPPGMLITTATQA